MIKSENKGNSRLPNRKVKWPFAKYSKLHFNKTLLPAVTIDILEGINTPLSLALAISYRNNSYMSIDETLLEGRHVNCYDTASELYLDLQAIALFKKSTYLQTEIDLREDLINRFIAIEQDNKENNLTLASRKSFQANSIIYTANRIIKRVLGQAPLVEEFTPFFGPGSTYSLTGDSSTIVEKLESTPDVTPHALHLATEFLQYYPDLFQSRGINLVPGDRVSAVPNTYKKMRLVCPGPSLNMLLQRNIGLAIKKRLNRVGIHIDTQQSFHGFLVKEFHDTIATIDMSDASDRIYTELVRQLFDGLPEWWALLNNSRSKRVLLRKDLGWHDLERFCSQGNGFIFELETLIFYSIAQASIILNTGKEGLVSVFGDDTIVNKDHAQYVVDALTILGMRVNSDKTYIDTRFKESCGVDTFDGINVRPLYFKEFSGGIYGYYELCNRVRQIASKRCEDSALCRNFYRPWKRIISYLEERHICYGPEELGDAVIHDTTNSYGTTQAGILRIKGLSTRYSKEKYRHPKGDRSGLSYALMGYDSNGVLPRGVVRSPKFIVYRPRSRGQEKRWL